MSTPTSPAATPRLSKLAVAGGVGLLCLTGISQTENRNLHATNLQLENTVLTWKKADGEKGAKIVSLDRILDRTKEELATEQKKSFVLTSKNGQLTTKVNGLTDLLKSTNGKLDTATNELAAMTEKAGKLDRELATSQKNEELLKSDVAAGVQRETTLKETVASYEKAKTELTAAIALKEEQIKTLDTEKMELAKNLAGSTEMLKAVKTSEESLKAELAAKETKMLEVDAGLAELTKVLAVEQAKAAALATTNEGMSKELTDTKAAVEALNQEKLQLVTAREELVKRLAELDTQVKELQEKNKGQQNANQQLKEERETLDTQAKKLSTDVQAMTAQAAMQQTLVTTLGEERDLLKMERDQLTGACGELMKKLEQLGKQVKILQSDFLTLRRLKEEARASLTTIAPVLP